MFLEMWKRRQAVIAWEWDLTTFEDDEQTRPEFEVKVKTKRINPVTKKPEPFLPGWNKAVRVVFTTSFVFLMVSWWENVTFPQYSYKYFAYQLSVLMICFLKPQKQYSGGKNISYLAILGNI